VIGKAGLPNLTIPLQFSFGSERESALDELNRLFDRLDWRNEQVQMVWHDDKGMKFVSGSVIVIQDVDHQACPALDPK
jgi:hypothetical protein